MVLFILYIVAEISIADQETALSADPAYTKYNSMSALFSSFRLRLKPSFETSIA